ncbi:hypothetical protein [Bradyrhizobium sp. USDA 4486]
MSWNYSVQLSDPSNAGGSADPILIYDIEQALGVWSQYILGTGTLVVALNVAATQEGREAGGPTSSAYTGTTAQGLSVYESSALYELTTGHHVSGTTSDITITIDPGYFKYLDLASGLTYGSQVPSNEYNPIVVFLHELMHGFGMSGWYNQSGALPGNYESTFDTFLSKTASGQVYFTGANAEAAYGGPVPITSNSTAGENYYHFGNQQSDLNATPSTVQDPLTLDLMNGIVFYYDYQYAISALDLGVLKDIGYNIRTAPIVAAHDISATRYQSFAASSLFTASTAAGDSITEYALWDTNGNGHWIVNGVPQATNVEIDISAAQLANTTYQAGAASDQLWIRAFDGVIWGKWQSFTVSVPTDNPPVVSASNVAAIRGETSAAATTLFSVSDADGDTITQYALWDSNGNGHWVVNGAVQASNTEIDITAAQLAQTSYQFGSAADQLWVRANDGIVWGAWVPFTATPFADHAPVVGASDFAATHNQNIAASGLFTATDVDGDTITNYQLWDSTTDPSSGHWVVGGVSQGSNVAIDVSAAQLATTTFQSGSGSDDLWVRANDGTLWGAWKEFHVNAPIDNAPVVNASDVNAIHGQNIAAGTLFTASDADHDAITGYQFWDSTADSASGHFVVAGAAQPSNRSIDVSAAQLANASFQSGSGSDDLWVRAFDGTSWSSWKEFHVNAPLDNPPVVTAADFTATHNQNVAASALLSASDADGDTVTNYQLWDSTTDPSSGHWVVGGVAQAANVAIGVTSAQLSTTTFQSGSGADDLWARAYDGFAWGPWKEFHVNAPLDRAPVVTAPDYHAAPSQSIAASSLFSVSDPDGDSITQYQFWDSTASVSSGHWAISGTVQPVNTAINVNAAQLAATSFQSGTVSDDLWVRASDGVSWSTWQEFHVLV